MSVAHAENAHFTYDIVSAPATKFQGNSLEVYPKGALASLSCQAAIRYAAVPYDMLLLVLLALPLDSVLPRDTPSPSQWPLYRPYCCWCCCCCRRRPHSHHTAAHRGAVQPRATAGQGAQPCAG